MLMPGTKQVAYDPRRYLDIENLDQAAEIILCPTEGLSVKERWEKETPALMEIIKRYVKPRSLVLDYGCGVGRLAKPLIMQLDCSVIGVDISPNMRGLAASLVESNAFAAISPEVFRVIFDGPTYFDAAIAVWVLQHCMDLQTAIYDLVTIKPGGTLIICNNRNRCVPVEGGDWADDGLDVNRMILDTGFHEIEHGVLDETVAPGWMQKETFWAVYEKR